MAYEACCKVGPNIYAHGDGLGVHVRQHSVIDGDFDEYLSWEEVFNLNAYGIRMQEAIKKHKDAGGEMFAFFNK